MQEPILFSFFLTYKEKQGKKLKHMEILSCRGIEGIDEEDI